MPTWTPVWLSACMSFCALFVHLLYVCLSLCLSVCLDISLSVNMSVSLLQVRLLFLFPCINLLIPLAGCIFSLLICLYELFSHSVVLCEYKLSVVPDNCWLSFYLHVFWARLSNCLLYLPFYCLLLTDLNSACLSVCHHICHIYWTTVSHVAETRVDTNQRCVNMCTHKFRSHSY